MLTVVWNSLPCSVTCVLVADAFSLLAEMSTDYSCHLVQKAGLLLHAFIHIYQVDICDIVSCRS